MEIKEFIAQYRHELALLISVFLTAITLCVYEWFEKRRSIPDGVSGGVIATSSSFELKAWRFCTVTIYFAAELGLLLVVVFGVVHFLS